MTITLNGPIADLVQEETKLRGYDSAEDLVYEAVELLVKKRIDDGIERGLSDVQAGRFEDISHDGGDSLIDSLFSKRIQ